MLTSHAGWDASSRQILRCSYRYSYSLTPIQAAARCKRLRCCPRRTIHWLAGRLSIILKASIPPRLKDPAMDRSLPCSRRKFLASAAPLPLTAGLELVGAEPDDPSSYLTRPPKPTKGERKPIAVVCTVYRPMSHAYHIAGRFIHGYARAGKHHVPRHYVSSIYT